MGVRVIAADLDPQVHLTSLFLEEERLEELWPDTSHNETIYGAIFPLISSLISSPIDVLYWGREMPAWTQMFPSTKTRIASLC